MTAKFAALLIACSVLVACCDKGSIPENLDKLQSSAASDRNDGALALARCGSKASNAVPRLGELLYDSNKGVQSAAAYALREINSPAARETLERVTAERRK